MGGGGGYPDGYTKPGFKVNGVNDVCRQKIPLEEWEWYAVQRASNVDQESKRMVVVVVGLSMWRESEEWIERR